MKVLVTGGLGFIGTHLCQALRSEGATVGVLDIAGSPREDVRDPDAVARAVEGVDAVFHLAAQVSVPLCERDPVGSYETNFLGTLRVLEACAAAGKTKAPRVIFASSSAVYGDVKGPCREDQPTAPPLSYYAAQKLASEQAISLYHRSRGLEAVTFRFFNVFGQGQDPKSPYSGVITVFARQARAGTPLTIFGQGHQTRDFVAVSDIVRALTGALKLRGEACDGRPINLGTGKSVSIEELARLVIEVSNSSSPVRHAEPRAGDVLHSVADIRRASEVLGWEPWMALREGLEELL